MIKNYIEGEWFYSTSAKTLKHTFATNHTLEQHKLIDEDGFLNEAFKEQIRDELGQEILENVQGPFGDEDIFSGDIFDNETHYNIELHNITQQTMDALQLIPNIKITIID